MFAPKRGRVATESAAFDFFCKQGIGRNPWPKYTLGMQASQMVHAECGNHLVDFGRLAWIQKGTFSLQNQILELLMSTGGLRNRIHGDARSGAAFQEVYD